MKMFGVSTESGYIYCCPSESMELADMAMGLFAIRFFRSIFREMFLIFIDNHSKWIKIFNTSSVTSTSCYWGTQDYFRKVWFSRDHR